MVLGRFVGGFGSFWVVLGGFGWFRVLVTTIQNGGQNKRKDSKRNNLGKREFLPPVPADGQQYVIARAESV